MGEEPGAASSPLEPLLTELGGERAGTGRLLRSADAHMPMELEAKRLALAAAEVAEPKVPPRVGEPPPLPPPPPPPPVPPLL